MLSGCRTRTLSASTSSTRDSGRAAYCRGGRRNTPHYPSSPPHLIDLDIILGSNSSSFQVRKAKHHEAHLACCSSRSALLLGLRTTVDTCRLSHGMRVFYVCSTCVVICDVVLILTTTCINMVCARPTPRLPVFFFSGTPTPQAICPALKSICAFAVLRIWVKWQKLLYPSQGI